MTVNSKKTGLAKKPGPPHPWGAWNPGLLQRNAGGWTAPVGRGQAEAKLGGRIR